MIWVLRIRDYLIVPIANTSHKAYLLSCELRCSSKLQMIQSLENFVSMAIQGTQVPMYTNTHYFYIFQFFFFNFWKTNKEKIEKTTKQKHERNTQSIKTRLFQNNSNEGKQVMHKQKMEREKKLQNHLVPFSFHTLEEPFLCVNFWPGSEGEELKPFKFERNMRALRRSPRGVKKDGNWFWFLNESILLLCWVANYL